MQSSGMIGLVAFASLSGKTPNQNLCVNRSLGLTSLRPTPRCTAPHVHGKASLLWQTLGRPLAVHTFSSLSAQSTDHDGNPVKRQKKQDVCESGESNTQKHTPFKALLHGSNVTDFSGGQPALSSSEFHPVRVNLRSADFRAFYRNQSAHGTMSTREARQWYLNQTASIKQACKSESPLKEAAKKAFSIRNFARSEARALMRDRITADRLNKEEPNAAWTDIVSRTREKLQIRGNASPTDDQIYQEIIQSSQRSRKSVNKALGLTQKESEKP